MVLQDYDGEWVIEYLDADKNELTHLHVESEQEGFEQAQFEFEVGADEWKKEVKS